MFLENVRISCGCCRCYSCHFALVFYAGADTLYRLIKVVPEGGDSGMKI